MSFTEQEIEEFKSEALELLDVAEKSLLSLDTGVVFRSAYDSIFRSFHNLKGASGMMELHKLQTHTHELESILTKFKEATALPKNYISFFLQGIDAARSILNNQDISFDYSVKEAEQNPTEIILPNQSEGASSQNKLAGFPQESETIVIPVLQPGLDEYLLECTEIIDKVSRHLQMIEKNQHDIETLHDIYRDVHSLKGASYLFGYNIIGDIAHAMESSMETLREGTHKPNQLLLNGLFKALHTIEHEVECIKNKTISNHNATFVQGLARALSKSASSLETIDFKTETKTETQTEAPPTDATLKIEILPEAATPQAVNTTILVPAKEKESESSGSIRVPVALLDKLMALMGEMVLVRNQVLQISNESEDLNFLNLSQRLNVVTNEIQSEMMKTRMQPIGNILNKFHRVVRDLSQDLKKNLNFIVEGAETELDKSLLEAIKDPLTHIIRNSCDHGIETPNIRKASGKSEMGTISVKASHESGQVVIEVKDDGKGLHTSTILKKAQEKGIISDTQTSRMGEKEIFNLIFAPGFSTAAQVTNVSGRGVGMDVVKTNIEKIGGTVELNSQHGYGTTIKLKIPLTLAIVPALVVHSCNQTFAIPQINLTELVRVDANSNEKIEYLQGAPVLRLREHILPLLDLKQILNPSQSEKCTKSVFNIVVLQAENQHIGLIVDEIADTADIVVKPINRLLKSLQIYSGATILGDGSVALIFDVQGLARVCNVKNKSSERTNKENQWDADQAHLQSELQDFVLAKLNSPTPHAIVLGYVHRLEEFSQNQIETSGSQRVVRYRGTILPIISANRCLGYPEHENIDPEKPLSIVVIDRGGQLFGIEFNEIIDTLSTHNEVNTSLIKQPGIIGNINAKENLIVVIDPYEIISIAMPNVETKNISFKNPEVITPEVIDEPLTLQKVKSPYRTRGGEILLVEDTAFFRKLIKSFLEQGGYSVVTANNGLEAQDILARKDQPFDLIVSDIEMPKMNGFKLASSVRQHKIHGTTPMLALSSRSDRKYINQGEEAGFNVYMEKIKSELLFNSVNQLITESKRSA